MKILKLTFSAVGPYPGKHSIDFTRLNNTGLYLINGSTGAGKTTIIDCIVYALYGKPSGDQSDPSRMRSDFAKPEQHTEVELEFETSAGHFVVTRSPAYMRPKARGEGFTESKAECKFFEVRDGEQRLIAGHIASANSELEARLGLTRDQFVQTVVLPQGQFATFLRADTVDREKVLQSIFKTDLFLKIAELLKRQAKDTGVDKANATKAIREELQRLSGEIGMAEEIKVALLSNIDSSLDEVLFAGIDELAPALQTALDEAEQEASRTKTIATAADAARTLAAKEQAAESAVTKAAAVLATAKTEETAAREALGEHAEVAKTIDVSLEPSEDAATWRTRVDAASTAVGALTAVVDTEARVAKWPEVVAAFDADVELQRKAVATADEDVAAIPALTDVQQAIIDAKPSAQEGNELAKRSNELEGAAKALKDHAKAEAELPAKRDEATVALQAHASAANEHDLAERELREGWAAQLALQLADGAPCVVCGSLEHPAPAHAADSAHTLDSVKALAKKREDALAVAQAAKTTLEQHEQRVAELASAITLDADALTEQEQQHAVATKDIAARSAAATAAETELTRLRARLDAAKTAKQTATIALATIETEHKSATTQHELDKAAVVSARGQFASVAAKRDAVKQLQSALSAMADAVAALTQAKTNDAEAKQQRAEFADRDGFGDTAEAEQIWSVASSEYNNAEQGRRSAELRRNALRDGRESLEQLVQKRKELVAGSAAVLELANLFERGKGNQFGLHIYVLQQLFQNVVEAANRRFETLLGGRYHLVPSREDGGDGRSVQGLGLMVHDGLTGKSRPAKSLSGGETFCASLALALGLADVVLMGSGGIRIDSLFIDEGFGSLDPKPLEDVMQMLQQLGSNGRLVGVISHVPDMKQAITERIEVRQAEVGTPTTLDVSWMQ